jgi:hypothetical protein
MDVTMEQRKARGLGIICCRMIWVLLASTKYVHIKSTIVYAPRRNWDSPPTPHPQASVPATSPLFLGGGEHSLARKGLGESQFRRGAYTVVLFICTYFVLASIGEHVERLD